MESKDFIRLIPPRLRRPNEQQNQGGENRPMPKSEEENQYENDKLKFIDMLVQYRVDLIVVAANCLEARMLKKSLKDIASNARQNPP